MGWVLGCWVSVNEAAHMKQLSFEEKHQKLWDAVEQITSGDTQDKDGRYPQYYRELCHHLALAKHRKYSPQLIDYLNKLVTLGHHFFYQHDHRYHFQWLDFLVRGFPRAIRQNKVFVLVAGLLFLVPLFGMAISCYLNPEFIYSLMGAGEVGMMESMYDPGNSKIGRERGSDTDIMMFGYYIQNNIGIGFRTFASGMLYGIGSIFFLIYNGLFIGAVAGHLTQLGYTSTFYPFIAGHGSFELTAIVFSGAAGLKLGYALIRPGCYSVKQSLKQAGREAIIIMYGVILMLLIAAFIEAFWSSTSSIPALIKYFVGGFFWVLHLLYFVYSGRSNGPE